METFELRNYKGQVHRFQLENTLIAFLPTVSSKLDKEHLHLLKEQMKAITKHVENVFVIVHQNEEEIAKVLKKKNFPFPILADSKARIAKQLQCYLLPIGIVQRSSFLYDINGALLFRKTFMSNIEEHFEFIYSPTE
ncbi:redoxin domain-containing protein [Flammeovirga aprica]|uniref:Peroxiredoxin family protein n=1 Tax=Flammeovirga aprica JL-4 TaxID=694437 RepID=A0A7X9P038_9BACT|nr:redoxin domain-containing protein [Flammeovirga aprica]NME67089.1 peroxiredoxin family protein [Flammeovirga aprica JL-4]